MMHKYAYSCCRICEERIHKETGVDVGSIEEKIGKGIVPSQSIRVNIGKGLYSEGKGRIRGDIETGVIGRV